MLATNDTQTILKQCMPPTQTENSILSIAIVGGEGGSTLKKS